MQRISSDFAAANVLVVGIGYGNDRAVDYTPVEGGGGAVKGGGGAEKFMLFIKNELIPKMENEYGADTSRMSRTILGHSFGGLLEHMLLQTTTRYSEITFYSVHPYGMQMK